MIKNLVQVESVVKTFGGLKALNDCSLEIKEKSITVSGKHLIMKTKRNPSMDMILLQQ